MDVYVSQKTFGEIVDDTGLIVFESGDIAITSIGGITVICQKNTSDKIFGGLPLKRYGYSGISTNEPSLSTVERFEGTMGNLEGLSPSQLKKIEAEAEKLRKTAQRSTEKTK